MQLCLAIGPPLAQQFRRDLSALSADLSFEMPYKRQRGSVCVKAATNRVTGGEACMHACTILLYHIQIELCSYTLIFFCSNPQVVAVEANNLRKVCSLHDLQ